MKSIGYALLGFAAIGTVSSTVFLALTLLGVQKFRRRARAQRAEAERTAVNAWPPVSILKPLHGAEPQLERNLESFFKQDYPGTYEVLFAVDKADDAALPIARLVCERHAEVQSRILVTGEPLWPNPPAYSFSRMTELAQHDILITSDSDVEVDGNYLRALVPLFRDAKTGMVTCIYRGLNTGGLWSALDAVGMSVEMTAGVLVANLLEGIKFGLGPTIAVRRDALEAIGGYEAVGDFFSNDFVIGNLIAANGRTVILSEHVISHVVPPMTFGQMWRRQVRWATGTKYSRPKGHLGTAFVFSIVYGLVGLIGGALAQRPGMGVVILAAAVLNRLIQNYAVGWGVIRDGTCLTRPWLYPMRDLLGFAVWVASYLSRRMTWRDGRFELVEGGRIRVRNRIMLEGNGAGTPST
jgi:ceramide glucosyltransferase